MTATKALLFRMRKSNDPIKRELLELANRLNDVSFTPLQPFPVVENLKHCYCHQIVNPGKSDKWIVRFSLQGHLLTLGVTENYRDAVRFADMVTYHLWPYCRIKAIGPENLNLSIEQAQKDLENEPEALNLILSIEKILVSELKLTKKTRQVAFDANDRSQVLIALKKKLTAASIESVGVKSIGDETANRLFGDWKSLTTKLLTLEWL